jgi:predicted nucleotidyltransferase
MKITPEQKKNIAKIAKKHGLELVVLFGSRANDKAKEKYSFSIAVLFADKARDKNTLRISHELKKVLGRPVKILTLNDANPFLLREVEQTGLLIFGRKIDYCEFNTFAFKMYFDFIYFLNSHGYGKEKRRF